MILAIAGVVLTVYAAVHLVNGIVDFVQSVFSGASPLFTGSITAEEILIGVLIGFVAAYTIRKRWMSRKAEAGTKKADSFRGDLSRERPDDRSGNADSGADYGRRVMNGSRQ